MDEVSYLTTKTFLRFIK